MLLKFSEWSMLKMSSPSGYCCMSIIDMMLLSSTPDCWSSCLFREALLSFRADLAERFAEL